MGPAVAPNGDRELKAALTCTDNSDILVMAAVLLTPAQVATVGQLPLRTDAIHVVQQDRTRTIAEVGLALERDGLATAQLTAHHFGVEHVPVIVAHRSPNIFVEDLHAALAAAVTVHHTDGWCACTTI